MSLQEKLRLKVCRVDRVLFVQVLSQPEDTRSLKFQFTSKGGYKLRSDGWPQLLNDSLYLRGNNHKGDKRVTYCEFSSDLIAMAAAAKLEMAVREFNAARAQLDKEAPMEGFGCFTQVVE